jgi:hypothetical protein
MPPRPISEEEVLLYKIRKEFITKMENGMFYIQVEEPAPEIESYSDRYTRKQKKVSFQSQISKIRISLIE